MIMTLTAELDRVEQEALMRACSNGVVSVAANWVTALLSPDTWDCIEGVFGQPDR
ncbi:MAG: hypothetical protein AB7G36_18845 [Candidatus Nanopelagicales bacterium]